jgi:site-specific recombinase XerD
MRRHHVAGRNLQHAVKLAISAAGIVKPASSDLFRHSFRAHLVEGGNDIRP